MVWDGIMLYKCWRVGTLFCVVLLCVLYVIVEIWICVSFLCISCVTILVVRLDGRKDIS